MKAEDMHALVACITSDFPSALMPGLAYLGILDSRHRA